MKSLVFLIIFLLPASILLGQQLDTTKSRTSYSGGVIGKVVDENRLPIAYANVMLVHTSDSSIAAITLTDSNGTFRINPPVADRYIVKVSAIGFLVLKTSAFTSVDSVLPIDFGLLTLKTEVKMLKGVTVSSLRPNIVHLADKMVIGIEGTAMSAGNTAYDVLSRAPGVFIDGEGNIQLNGRSGVMVMLDGRQTYLSAKDLRTMLESMPAESLKNIEIITNPSAKYDAEGTSGILNINLKKNVQQGLNGFVLATYNYNFEQQHGGAVSWRIYHKKGKWNSFVGSDLSRRVGGRDATFTREFHNPSQTIFFDQWAEGSYRNLVLPSIRMGTDYSFSDQHSIGVMASFVRNMGKDDFNTSTFIGKAPKSPQQLVQASNNSFNTYRNITTNFHYTGKLDTLGSLLTSDIDFVKIWNRGFTDMYNFYTDVASGQSFADVLYSHTPNSFHIYSGKIDLVLPMRRKSKFEVGAKASRVISDNDYEFYFNNNDLVLDPSRTNHFKYKESIYAGYTNWSKAIHDKISVQGGLRVEHTVSDAHLITTGDITIRQYTNLFPSLFLQQKVTDNYAINYSYSRRLNRPSYGSLNIFKAYRDPYTYYQGNPFLRPQYTNAFTITQSFKRNYIITLNYNIFKDALAETPMIDVNEGVTVYSMSNLNSGTEYGMTAMAPLKIMKRWDSQNTLTLFHNKNKMQTNLGNIVNDQLLVSFQSFHTILLPKNFKAELNMYFRGPAANGLYLMAPVYRMDVAIKKSFANNKVDATMNIVDVFKSFRYLWTADLAGNVSDFDQYFRVRTVGFSLRYNFSKGQQVEQKRKSAGLEEVNRTN